MNAIIHLDDYRCERVRDGYISDLADELHAVANTPEGRVYMAGYYEGMQWASAADIAAALALMAEREEPA